MPSKNFFQNYKKKPVAYKPPSSNWTRLTEEMANGPRKNEQIYRTPDAKYAFHLETHDLEKIQGYKRGNPSWGGGDPTLYCKLVLLRPASQASDDNVECPGVWSRDETNNSLLFLLVAHAVPCRARF